jgi:hypothetical protein
MAFHSSLLLLLSRSLLGGGPKIPVEVDPELSYWRAHVPEGNGLQESFLNTISRLSRPSSSLSSYHFLHVDCEWPTVLLSSREMTAMRRLKEAQTDSVLMPTLSRGFVLFLAALWTTRAVDGFHLSQVPLRTWKLSWNHSKLSLSNFRQRLVCFASDDGDDNSSWSADDSPLEAMRRMLESSWDANTMGRVPLDATAGANEVYAALMEAERVEEELGNVHFVELLLPAYDITQGERMYDEVGGLCMSETFWRCGHLLLTAFLLLHFSGNGS